MEQKPGAACLGSITFRNLVKDCASSEAIVAAFNTACRMHLKAPIKAFLKDDWPSTIAAEEELMIGAFILFVHGQFWMNEHIWTNERIWRKARTEPKLSQRLTDVTNERVLPPDSRGSST